MIGKRANPIGSGDNSTGMSSWAKVGRAVSVCAVMLILTLVQEDCGRGVAPESNLPSEAQSTKASLFTVSEEQLPHLRIGPVKSSTWQINVATTGTVDWDADHTSQAITQVSGPITRIVVDYGSHVKAGDPLLYVASPDITTAVATYKKAHDQQDLAKKVLDREKELLAHGAAAVKDVESAEATYNDAATDVQNSLQALKIFAITPQELNNAEQQGGPISPELAVRAPIAGTVVQKLVMPGQLIQAGSTTCFLLSDTSTVWVQGHIFDRDLPLVRIGDAVEETNSSFDRTFHGKVAYVGAMVDPDTRTTPVRIVTQNPGDLLKKDMYLEAVIHTMTDKRVLSVPVSAVLHDSENEPFVYVEVQPRQFARRSIAVGAQQNGYIEIRNGLKAGEEVVSEGSVFLQFASNNQ
jgi:membrane fusion protein, heavy metal efflux system